MIKHILFYLIFINYKVSYSNIEFHNIIVKTNIKFIVKEGNF